MPTRFFRSLIWAGRRAKLRWGAALGHWAAREWNPYLAGELHRSQRHKSGPFWLLWSLFFIGAALRLAALFREELIALLLTVLANYPWLPVHAGRIAGESTLGLMALLAAGCCGWKALLSGMSATATLGGANKAGALTEILLLPIPERRLALLTTAPAAIATALLWALLLPLWIMAWATGQWSAWQFFGLPLLLQYLALAPPSWTPISEPFIYTPVRRREKNEDDQTPPEDEEGKDEAPPPTNEDETAERLRAARAAALHRQCPDPRSETLFAFDPVGALWLLVIWQGVQFGARAAGYHVPTSVFTYLLPNWSDLLSRGAWNLLLLLPFSWPLLVIELLVAPRPFFGTLLPLGLWLVPRFLMARYAAYCVFRLTYADEQSLRHRRWALPYPRLKRAQAWLFWFFGAGFAWPWLVEKGALAAVLPGAPINASWARAGLWTLLWLVTIWAINARWHGLLAEPLKPKKPGFHRANLARWRRAVRRHEKWLFAPFVIYFVLCWLGGSSGIDTVWLARLVPTLLVGAAFLLTHFGAITLRDALPAARRALWGWLRFAWFWGLFWAMVYQVVRAHYGGKSFALADAPYLLFSPLVSLLALLNHDIYLPLQGALWQLGAALVLFGLTARLAQRAVAVPHAASAKTPQADETPRRATGFFAFWRALWLSLWRVPRRVLRMVCWPLIWAGRWFYRMAKRALNAGQSFLSAQAAAGWQWIDEADNPIMRRALKDAKRENAALSWCSFAVLPVGTLLLVLGVALIQPLGLLFYGGNTPYNRQAAWQMLNWRDWGDVVFWVTMACGTLLNVIALFSQTKAFDKERANGGMVFLALTPLHEKEIIGGYFGAALVPNLWLHSALYPCLALAMLLLALAGKTALLPHFALLTALLHTQLIFAAMTSIWGATRADQAASGGAWAFFYGGGPQALLVFILLGQTREVGVSAMPALTAFGILLTLLGTALLWKNALLHLRRERFGDVSVKGTVAN